MKPIFMYLNSITFACSLTLAGFAFLNASYDFWSKITLLCFYGLNILLSLIVVLVAENYKIKLINLFILGFNIIVLAIMLFYDLDYHHLYLVIMCFDLISTLLSIIPFQLYNFELKCSK